MVVVEVHREAEEVDYLALSTSPLGSVPQEGVVALHLPLDTPAQEAVEVEVQAAASSAM